MQEMESLGDRLFRTLDRSQQVEDLFHVWTTNFQLSSNIWILDLVPLQLVPLVLLS